VTEFDQAVELLARSRRAAALTGAGISVDSGIPDFRSPGGLWDRFDPFEYATIQAFVANPEKVWVMLKEMNTVVTDARPNAGHQALAELEDMGVLRAIITQNIDNLHQDAGSRQVIEFHGNVRQLLCLRCRRLYPAAEAEARALATGEFPPRCPDDGRILKPDVVLFGEGIPPEASSAAQIEAEQCDVMLVIGTSATVFPASSIPMIARANGAKIIEVNITATALTGAIAHVSVLGSSTAVLPRLVEAVRRQRA